MIRPLVKTRTLYLFDLNHHEEFKKLNLDVSNQHFSQNFAEIFKFAFLYELDKRYESAQKLRKSLGKETWEDLDVEFTKRIYLTNTISSTIHVHNFVYDEVVKTLNGIFEIFEEEKLPKNPSGENILRALREFQKEQIGIFIYEYDSKTDLTMRFKVKSNVDFNPNFWKAFARPMYKNDAPKTTFRDVEKYRTTHSECQHSIIYEHPTLFETYCTLYYYFTHSIDTKFKTALVQYKQNPTLPIKEKVPEPTLIQNQRHTLIWGFLGFVSIVLIVLYIIRKMADSDELPSLDPIPKISLPRKPKARKPPIEGIQTAFYGR